MNARPDILPTVSVLASYTTKPTNANWRGVTHLLSYLLGSKDRKLRYDHANTSKQAQGTLRIVCYCDASFNSPTENLTKRKTVSRAGYLVFVNGCLIKWYSKIIRRTPQSSEEAEVIAMNELLRFLKWFCDFLRELGIPSEKPIVKCDKANAVNWFQTLAVTDRTKHFATKLNLCRDSFEAAEFEIQRVSGTHNPADLMSKQRPWQKHDQFTKALGMIDEGPSSGGPPSSSEEVLAPTASTLITDAL
jgi:hypothetical protein